MYFLVTLLLQRVPQIGRWQGAQGRWAIDKVLALPTWEPELNAHESHKKARHGGICSWCWECRDGQKPGVHRQVSLACVASSRLMRIPKIKMSDAWGIRTKLISWHIRARTHNLQKEVGFFVCLFCFSLQSKLLEMEENVNFLHGASCSSRHGLGIMSISASKPACLPAPPSYRHPLLSAMSLLAVLRLSY